MRSHSQNIAPAGHKYRKPATAQRPDATKNLKKKKKNTDRFGTLIDIRKSFCWWFTNAFEEYRWDYI